MFKNRVTLSIVLGFFAALLAFHCDLAFSQTTERNGSGVALRGAGMKNASMNVSVRVMSSCRFVTGPLDSAEALRRWVQANADGQTAARCGASQPLMIAAGKPTGASVTRLSGTADRMVYGGGSPFEAQAFESHVLISF